MVKLLRLTSDRADGVFDIKFNENIIIEPKSKIGLKNLSITMDEKTLDIDNSNHELVFNTNDSNAIFVRGLFLPYDDWTVAQYTGLLSVLNNHTNRQLECNDNDNDFNTQIDYNVNTNNFFKIEYFKSILFDLVPTLATANDDVIMDKTANQKIEVFHTGGNGVSTQQYKLAFEDTFIKGAGVFRCRIADFTDNLTGLADNGFEIGLSDEPPSNFIDSDAMSNYQRTYMIRFNRIGSLYTFLKTRTRDDTTAETDSIVNASSGVYATPDVNDILEIRLDKGNIVGNVYIHDGTSYQKNEIFRDPLYGDLTYDVERSNKLGAFHNLYPYIVLYGRHHHMKIRDIQHSFEEKNMMHYIERTKQDLTLPQINIPTIDEPVNININKRYTDSYNLTGEFNFPTRDMASYFGFEKTDLTSSSDGYQPDGSFKNMKFIGTKLFKPAIYSRSFVVEILNLPLISYDSKYGGRKSILATVIDTNAIYENTNDSVIYEPNTVDYIDLDNINKLNIRNIKIKIVDKNLDDIEVQGISVMTLLIEEP